MKILESALRQYKHNDGNGFVFGYDIEETDEIVAELIEEIADLTVYVLRVHDVAKYWHDKYEECIKGK